ncbi:DUF6896 domain-containing protein [Chryseobacterium paridis]|uniref:DUF6896 domain-containing protein n=1 Tax=Chryseobacterium paridis TaxID=2800328 RepID=A0ABS1FYS3_9FLAO|nr:hypothetical protein [Chryseobacterium paridis]MBK1897609.1 hypothetical protein [Chryseobacterium paridis]
MKFYLNLKLVTYLELLERTTEIIKLQSIDKFPPFTYIKNIPRNKKLKILFDKSIQHLREDIVIDLRNNLSNFQITIHTIEPEINIVKLISDEEIITNQLFFESCAKDYRKLGEELVFMFAQKKKIKFNHKFPSIMFNQLKGKEQKGKIGDWKYFIHGFHCHFGNIKTKQKIEVPFMFGMEFGDLDPYFFMQFIKSSTNYHPLPVNIYEDYADGARIIEVMLNLGLFEKITSNFKEHTGVVVTDRDKVEIALFNDNEEYYHPKFNLLKFLGLKK